MAYFVGIAGTHSTGKSTFVGDISKKARSLGISVEIVSDTATKCQNEGFPILRAHTFESTLWIMTSVIKAELEAERKADLVLVDRPLPDALGYLEAALKTTGRSITPEQQSYLYGLAKLHTGRYTLLLKTLLDDSIPLGPNRDPDLNFRSEADKAIEHALNSLDVPSLAPASDTSQERIHSIFEMILAGHQPPMYSQLQNVQTSGEDIYNGQVNAGS